MKIHTQVYFTLLLLTMTTLSQAQFINSDPKTEDPIKKTAVYKPELGGPKSITRTIIQDKNENIWLASWEGIFKYDGSSYTNLTKEVSLSRFFSILENSKGNFWFGSIGSGAYFYDGKTFKNFTTKEGLVHNNVKYIYEDNKSNVWFATQGGVSVYDGQTFRNFTTEQGLLHNDTNYIIEDKLGRIWFASRGEVSIFDGKTFSEFKKVDGQSFHNVRTIIEDKYGDIWLGGEDGLWQYDGSTLILIVNKFIGFLYEDSKGSLWTSIEGGKAWEVIRFDRNPLFNTTLTSTQIWTDHSMAFGILEDKSGNFWFGTLNGACIYDGINVDCLEK